MSILCPFPYGQGYISPQDTYNGEKYKLTDIFFFLFAKNLHSKSTSPFKRKTKVQPGYIYEKYLKCKVFCSRVRKRIEKYILHDDTLKYIYSIPFKL